MKRILSLALTVVIVISMFPISIFASSYNNIVDIIFEDTFIYDGTQNSYNGSRFFKTKFIIVFADGSTHESFGGEDGVRVNGEYVGHISYSFFQDVHLWEIGDIYEATGSIAGVSGTYKVEVRENPIEEISIDDFYVFKSFYNEESYTNGTSYVVYGLSGYSLLRDYDRPCKVTYKDQSSEIVYDSHYTSEKLKEIYFTTTCDVSPNAWESGNTYEITATLFGKNATFNVTVLEIENIEIDDISYMQGTNGWRSHDPDNEWYEYNISPKNISITVKNGDVISGEYYEICEQLGCYGHCSSNQSFENQWGVGEHTATINFMGFVTDYNINITESIISGIEITDIEIVEYTSGWEYEGKYIYEYYTPVFSVTFTDGTVKSGLTNCIEIDNESYMLHINTWELQQEQSWVAGNTYQVTGTLMGVSDTFNVTIIESPVASIEINDVSIIEYSNGYYDNDKFYYHSPTLCGTVTYKDGTTEEFSNGIYIDDEWYSIDTDMWDIQNEKSLTVGTYEITGTVLGVSDTFNLAITETPIESIDIKDITLYDGIHNYGGEYYFNPVFDVVLKNGDVYKDNVNGFSLNGTHFSVNCTYDQENWEVGNTYSLSGKVAGFSDTFNVTIKETPVKSVEFTKMPRTEYITGEYFDIRGAELRINYNDGKYEDIIMNDCIYYTNTLLIKCEYFDLSFECFFEQYFSEVGKQTVEFDVLGKKLKVDVNVSKNLAESAKLKVDNDELVITITNSDGSSYDLKIVGNCIPGGGVDNMVGWFYAEDMIFEAMVHFVYDEDTKTYSNVSFELINFVDEVLKTNEVKVCEWLKIYDKASNIYWGITFSRDYELISYLGEITKENIDVIISTAAYLEYGHYMAEYELDDGKYYGKFTADEIRTAVYKHFDIDYIDVSISDKYDSKNDVVYVSDMDGGGPERTTVTKYDNYWYLELISFDFVKYYVLCDEEGKIIAFDTNELYEPEFGYITDSGEYENIYWQYFEETKTLKISGKSEIPDFTTSYLAQPWYLYKNKIEKLVIDGEFTSIGNNAFSKLTALSTVIMPDKIRFIKKGAFADCIDLLEIVLPNNIKEIFKSAFEGCKKLSSVKGLEYVLSIGEQAFAGCDLKGTISLNRALYVESNAFDGCDDIKVIKYGPDTYTDISSNVLGDHNPLIYVTYGSPIFYDVIFDNKTFFLIGDLNNDGLLNACDIIRLRRYLLDETVADKYISDINLDGETDVRDLVKIKKIIANIF